MSGGQRKAKPQPAPGAPVSRHRLLLFRALLLLSPLVLLVLAEVGLRWAGAGYKPSFLLKTIADGRGFYTENPKFGFRFFPPAVARSPLPLRVETPKPPDTLRILVLGESAAMGDPEPAYGLARQLERLLRARHPQRRIEVLNVAMTAINSHVFRVIAEDCRELEASVWVVYAGNNEVIGPFGAGTVFGRQAASLPVVRAQLWFKSTRLGQWLTGLPKNKGEPIQWEGMELFLDQQLRADDPRLRRTQANYRTNLEAIVRAGRASGAQVLLCTMPVNLKDCPPFASLHAPGFNSVEFHPLRVKALAAERRGDVSAAEEAWRQAQKLAPAHAETAFRIGALELAKDSPGPALELFQRARDLDALRFRADSDLNGTVREVAKAANAQLVDTEAAINAAATNGIPGDDLFYDHVHPNFIGNYRAAVALLSVVEKAAALPATDALVPAPETMAAALAFTAFDERRVAEEMRARLRQPPFTFQSNREERDRRWEAFLSREPQDFTNVLQTYRAAVQDAPDDWVLHANFARALDATGQARLAAEQWREVGRLMAHLPDPWFELGNLAQNENDWDEAREMFERALHQKPDSPEALNGLGLVASSQGKGQEAVAFYQSALRVNPRYSVAAVNLAAQLARQGDETAAVAQYEKVITSDTNSVAARVNYGNLLGKKGQWEHAAVLYREAAALAPNDPLVNYSLGKALVALGRYPEAADHFVVAVKFSPDFAEARYQLAMELVRAGKVQESLPHFEQAVRLRPGLLEAWFNYGIAFAKLRQWQPAIEQLEQALKIDPNYQPARTALDRARQLSGR